MKRSLLLSAAALLAGVVAADAGSPDAHMRRRPFCADHEQLTAKLRSDYQQEQTGAGQIGPDRVMEIYISRKGDWTVLITETNNVACIVAAGDDWNSKNLVFAQGT